MRSAIRPRLILWQQLGLSWASPDRWAGAGRGCPRRSWIRSRSCASPLSAFRAPLTLCLERGNVLLQIAPSLANSVEGAVDLLIQHRRQGLGAHHFAFLAMAASLFLPLRSFA